MNEFFDIYTLIFLGLAVYVIIRLRAALGRRTGNERPPFDPYSNPREHSSPREAADGAANDQKVVDFPGAASASGDKAAEAHANKIDSLAPKGSALNEALRTILAADRSFDPKEFLNGAKQAYEMIVMSFAHGNRETLDMLLTRDVFESFNTAIEERESRNETIDQTFVGIDRAELVEAQLEEDEAQITIRFRSQLITSTRDPEGAVVDGDPNKVVDVVDLWTFARDTTSRDPNWRLVATQSVD